MNILTAATELAESLGLSIANVDTKTKLYRWLNMSYQDVVGNWSWSWLKIYTTVTLQMDYSTGNVAVNTGGTTITFDTPTPTSMAGRYIQFSSSKAWYKIVTNTAGTTTATITPAYAPTTNYTSSTFLIRTIFYSLPSNVEHVVGARQTSFPLALEVMDRTRYNQFVWWSNLVGPTSAYIPAGLDTSGNWTFTPYPFPNDTYILEFYCLQRINDLVGDTESPIFPARFNTIWIQGALAYGYQFLEDDKSDACFKRFYDMLEGMFSKDNPAANEHYVTKPSDAIPANRGVVLPATYGPNQY